MSKNDDVWVRNEVESPCIKICLVHPEARICTGCYRTMDEIAIWSKLSVEARRVVMEELPSRASLVSKRRGGRAARLKR